MPVKTKPALLVRRRVQITGVVQGVGFRPYIYRLANECQLSGTVLNDSAGVDIEIQGSLTSVESFLERLKPEAPPLSRIVAIDVGDLPVYADGNGFRIIESHGTHQQKVLISPDVAICDDCLREMFNPADRRYRFPFINCTNCGPRFTIVRDIPYDRPLTTMSVFPMCGDCEREYRDPANRRFHAQPNACWECGPQLQLWDAGGRVVEVGDPMSGAAKRITAGEIVAVKGLGGFHLAVDALNAGAVERLRERKRRFEKPLAIMVPDIASAHLFGELDDEQVRLLGSVQRPIVLVARKEGADLPEEIAPGIREIGIFLPYTPLHHLLFEAGKFAALVMTSANVSEEPIAIGNEEAVRRLGEIADSFLVHDREILIRSDDSVVRTASGRVQQVRRSRGYVPMPVFLEREVPEILAVGGELKNTICLTRGKTAFLSQHIGDLENVESFGFFHETVEHLTRILEIEPRAIAYDLHPDYFSTKWALAQTGKPLIGVQHHHAHIASSMAENRVSERVIGFALDGAGYGTDGHIWGGEVLVADYKGFERPFHLEYVPLPGGAAAVREPWRMAVSYLHHHFGEAFYEFPIDFVRRLDERKADFLVHMIQHGVNSPLTSSCGRLFDAVAALLGIRDFASYEGQAAIQLENLITGDDIESYPAEIEDGLIKTAELFEGILQDLASGVPAGQISRRFHNTLVDLFVSTAEILRDQLGLSDVCLSGGSFQNLYLSQNLRQQLELREFRVFAHSEVPCNDGGLSLGQALIASHLIS
jgi:hydrogenase maturation protein HypF